MRVPGFTIADEVRRLGVRGAYAVFAELDNTREPPGLASYREALAARLAAELDAEFIARDPVLAGFRALHDAVGRSNRRFVASAEALVGLFQRKRLLPVINPVVDLYNYVSLETRLSLGAHDLAQVEGDIELRLTRGGERFVPLGAVEPEPIPAGEYGYIDDVEIICRLEHRQCERTKVTPATHECFLILQGNAATPASMLESALERLTTLYAEHCGGRLLRSWIAGD